jgi:hypothetical protein
MTIDQMRKRLLDEAAEDVRAGYDLGERADSLKGIFQVFDAVERIKEKETETPPLEAE